jgi:DNA-binding MarR family transcriptional regulator
VVIMADGPGSQRVGSRYLSVAYRVRKVLDEHMIASGLSLARAKVLQVLAENGSLRQTSLAEELGFAQRTVTQAVEALARDGLVKRTPGPPATGRRQSGSPWSAPALVRYYPLP